LVPYQRWLLVRSSSFSNQHMQVLFNIKPRTLVLTSAFAVLLGTSGCNPTKIDPVTDPNNPSLESVTVGANLTQLGALATGVEASYRLGHTNNAPYYQITGVLGREIIILASNEPRWYGEILGTKPSGLDNNSFYSVGSYNAFARMIRGANVLRQSSQATSVITDAQKQGILGFADTYEALGKLMLVNLMGENGIRIDVADYLHPGKFTAGSAPALANIRQLLDQGAAELAKASNFPFTLSSGFAGFNTPATFLKFNRALAARVALYQGDNAGALTALSASFYNPSGALTTGPKLTFSPGTGGDEGNVYYQVPNTGPSTLVTVPDNFVNEAEPGDLRLSKVSKRTTPRSVSGAGGAITGNYDPVVYTAQTTPLSIIRNEELILISAEAKAKTADLTGAVSDINVIRTTAGGLAPYSGAVTQADLINEVLRQRRYSLFYEGQWWVDLRRLGKLNPNPAPNITLPLSTAPYTLFDRLAKPFAEVSWDQANP
jgi:hypothetical protein